MAHRRALLAAFVATTLVFLWQAATVRYNYGGNWTGLFCTGSSLPVPPELATTTKRSIHPVGYDGQWYRYMAHDPLLRHGFSKYIDDPQLRYRRILISALAFALAGGYQPLIDYAYIFLILISIFAGCYWSGRYCALFGKSEWWGSLFILIPGVITSFDRMLTDGPETALYAGFLVYAERREWSRLYLVSLLGMLARESGIILVAAIVLADLWNRHWKRAVIGATAALPAFAWWLYVMTHTGASHAAPQIMTFPLIGHLRRFLVFRTAVEPWKQNIIQISDVIALIALLFCFGLGVYWIIRERNREIQFSVGLLVFLGLVLGTPGFLIEPYGFVRPISPLLIFLTLRSVTHHTPWGLTAPLILTLATLLNLVNQFFGVVKGLLP